MKNKTAGVRSSAASILLCEARATSASRSITHGIRASYGARTNALRDSHTHPLGLRMPSFFHLRASRGLHPPFLISWGARCRRRHSGWAHAPPVWIRTAVSWMIWSISRCIGVIKSSTLSAAALIDLKAPLMRIAALRWILVNSLIVYRSSPAGIALAAGQYHANTPYSICGTTTAWYTFRMAASEAPHTDPVIARRASRLPLALASNFWRCVLKSRCLSSQTPRYLADCVGCIIKSLYRTGIWSSPWGCALSKSYMLAHSSVWASLSC